MFTAEAAQALGVRIYTIGVGTRGVARVPYVNVFGQKGYIDQQVDIDEETLTAVAQKTGGKYFRAENAPYAISAIRSAFARSTSG